MERVYISEEHNKSMFGKHSPGPCSYSLKGAMGKQVRARARVRADRLTRTLALNLTLTLTLTRNLTLTLRTLHGSTVPAHNRRGRSAAPSASSTTTSSAP